MLERRGFSNVRRWGVEARLDHEHSLQDYREDLQVLADLLTAGCEPSFGEAEPLFRKAEILTQSTIDTIGWFENEVDAGRISAREAMDRVIGQGHHRLFATKGS